MKRLSLVWASGLLVAALGPGCGTPPPTMGTATLRFQASSLVKRTAMSPLNGTIYGSIWLAEDLTVTGPIQGAMDIQGVQLSVDLRNQDVSAATFKMKEVPAGEYGFLGFYDLNANGMQSQRPDGGDPVTLGTSNKFNVQAGQDTAYTVTFDIVFN